VQTYVKDLQALVKQRQDAVRERNRQIGDGVLAAVNDPRRPRAAARVEQVPPAMNFAPLENAATDLTRAAERAQRALTRVRDGGAVDDSRARGLNARLIQSERQFIDDAGLFRRPWYRHLLYAPGYYLGYGAKTVPGVREAIEEKRYADVEAEVARVARALEREVTLLDALSADVDGAAR
jgi:N-acetylated-alpha-linked acidic dipeptidase